MTQTTENVFEIADLMDLFLRRFFAGMHAEAHAPDMPVSPHSVKILMRIRNNPGLAISAVVEATHRDKSQITRAIKALEAKHLVRRAPSESDGRVSTLWLTVNGEAIAARMEARARRHLSGLIAPLDAPQQTQLAQLLRTMLEAPPEPCERQD